MQKKIANKNYLKLLIIHAILTLLIPFVIVFTLGCEDDLEPVAPTIGKQVTQDAFSVVWNAAFEGTGPDQLLVGASALYLQNITIEGSAPFLQYECRLDVLDTQPIEDEPDLVRLSLLHTSLDYSYDPPYRLERKEVYDLRNTTLGIACSDLRSTVHSNAKPQLLAKKTLKSILQNLAKGELSVSPNSVSHQAGDVTIHDLVSVKSVAKSPGDCLDYDDCMIPVTDIKVNIVTWTSATTFEKTEVHLVTSAETPWFSRILQLCQNGFIPYEDRRLFANQCTVLSHFKLTGE